MFRFLDNGDCEITFSNVLFVKSSDLLSFTVMNVVILVTKVLNEFRYEYEKEWIIGNALAINSIITHRFAMSSHS